jgi:hypothetical protein
MGFRWQASFQLVQIFSLPKAKKPSQFDIPESRILRVALNLLRQQRTFGDGESQIQRLVGHLSTHRLIHAPEKAE